MASRASEELLGQLHEAVTKLLLEKVLAGDITPSELSTAVKLLKDNGIEAVMAEGSPLHDLYKNLPQFTDEDEESDYVN